MTTGYDGLNKIEIIFDEFKTTKQSNVRKTGHVTQGINVYFAFRLKLKPDIEASSGREEAFLFFNTSFDCRNQPAHIVEHRGLSNPMQRCQSQMTFIDSQTFHTPN